MTDFKRPQPGDRRAASPLPPTPEQKDRQPVPTAPELPVRELVEHGAELHKTEATFTMLALAEVTHHFTHFDALYAAKRQKHDEDERDPYAEFDKGAKGASDWFRGVNVVKAAFKNGMGFDSEKFDAWAEKSKINPKAMEEVYRLLKERFHLSAKDDREAFDQFVAHLEKTTYDDITALLLPLYKHQLYISETGNELTRLDAGAKRFFAPSAEEEYETEERIKELKRQQRSEAIRTGSLRRDVDDYGQRRFRDPQPPNAFNLVDEARRKELLHSRTAYPLSAFNSYHNQGVYLATSVAQRAGGVHMLPFADAVRVIGERESTPTQVGKQDIKPRSLHPVVSVRGEEGRFVVPEAITLFKLIDLGARDIDAQPEHIIEWFLKQIKEYGLKDKLPPRLKKVIEHNSQFTDEHSRGFEQYEFRGIDMEVAQEHVKPKDWYGEILRLLKAHSLKELEEHAEEFRITVEQAFPPEVLPGVQERLAYYPSVVEYAPGKTVEIEYQRPNGYGSKKNIVGRVYAHEPAFQAWLKEQPADWFDQWIAARGAKAAEYPLQLEFTTGAITGKRFATFAELQDYERVGRDAETRQAAARAAEADLRMKEYEEREAADKQLMTTVDETIVRQVTRIRELRQAYEKYPFLKKCFDDSADQCTAVKADFDLKKKGSFPGPKRYRTYEAMQEELGYTTEHITRLEGIAKEYITLFERYNAFIDQQWNTGIRTLEKKNYYAAREAQGRKDIVDAFFKGEGQVIFHPNGIGSIRMTIEALESALIPS